MRAGLKRTGATARPDQTPLRILRSMLALDDFEAPARRYIPRPIFGYVSGGAETNASMRGNRAAFDDLAFVPKALVLGAQFVFVGRPFLYAAAVAGEASPLYRDDFILRLENTAGRLRSPCRHGCTRLYCPTYRGGAGV